MIYVDYLFNFPDHATATTALPPPKDDAGNPIVTEQWLDDAGRSIRPCRSIYKRATYDDEGNEVTPEVLTPGYWMRVRTTKRDAELEGMPECLAAFDVEAGKAGKPFVYFHHFDPATTLTIIEPALDCPEYPDLVGKPASALDSYIIGGKA